jgi:integrase/recombinase XerD
MPSVPVSAGDTSAEAPSSAHISVHSLLAPTIKAWRYYLEDQGSSKHTVKAFMSDMNLLASYLPPDRTLGSIVTPDLTGFLDWMQAGRGVPCSPKTLARRITSIKAFFRWLNQNAVVLINPAEKIPQRTVISPLPQVLTLKKWRPCSTLQISTGAVTNPDSAFTLCFCCYIPPSARVPGANVNHLELDPPNGPFIFVRYASPQYRYKERKIELPES